MGEPDRHLRLRIVVSHPPAGVAIQVQRGKDALEPPVRTARDALTFEFTVRVGTRPTGAPNFLGPFAQGPPDQRFVYVNAGTSAGQAGSPWSRRAKIPLAGIGWPLIERACRAGAPLEVEIPGTGRDGGPTCASVRLATGWRLAPET